VAPCPTDWVFSVAGAVTPFATAPTVTIEVLPTATGDQERRGRGVRYRGRDTTAGDHAPTPVCVNLRAVVVGTKKPWPRHWLARSAVGTYHRHLLGVGCTSVARNRQHFAGSGYRCSSDVNPSVASRLGTVSGVQGRRSSLRRRNGEIQRRVVPSVTVTVPVRQCHHACGNIGRRRTRREGGSGPGQREGRRDTETPFPAATAVVVKAGAGAVNTMAAGATTMGASPVLSND